MKRILFAAACLASLAAFSQSPERPWSLGLHGGLSQYNGELGNDFYKVGRQPFYGHLGFTASRYLMRRMDLTFFYTYGDMGHFENESPEDPGTTRNFLTRLSTYNLLLRYHILPSNYIARPYVFAGAGVLRQVNANSEVRTPFFGNLDYSLPTAGAGVKVKIFPFLYAQFQETFMFTSADYIDLRSGGRNDWYLMHTLGLTVDFSLKRKPTMGVGDRIDECAKVSKAEKERVRQNKKMAKEKKRKNKNKGRK